jgi:hypothetical protein
LRTNLAAALLVNGARVLLDECLHLNLKGSPQHALGTLTDQVIQELPGLVLHPRQR